MTRIGRTFPAILAACLAARFASAQTPLDAVVAAVEAEGAASSEHADLTLEARGKRDVYVVERAPGGLHLIRTGASTPIEYYAVGKKVSWRSGPGAWIRHDIQAIPYPPVSASALLRATLAGVSETSSPAGAGTRTYKGSLEWSKSDRLNKGTFTIVVATSTGLPVTFAFQGKCGGLVCRFEEKMNYDSSIRIEPPS